jgi:ADP-heptose:LPS heptosyltransferase
LSTPEINLSPNQERLASGFRESELQLAAIQLESIRTDYSNKSLLGKLRHRFSREFFGRDTDQKIQFLKTILSRAAEKLVSRFAGRRSADIQTDFPANRLRIAAICTGGMGDIIIARGFLERFSREYGRPFIDIIVAASRLPATEFVFQESPAVGRVLAQADLNPATTLYDVIVRIGDLLSYDFVRKSALEEFAPDLIPKFREAVRTQGQYATFIQRQPSLDGLFASHAVKVGLRRLDVLGWLGNVAFTQRDQLYLSPKTDALRFLADNEALWNQPYITIHNGWDNVDHRHTTAATKAWPAEHYAAFVQQFKSRFPEIQVVQLGTKTSEPIPHVDHCLLNQTSLDETAWLLKKSLLHIDGDSGLVHMARALHSTSLVLFGPTNHAFFAYEQNLTLHATNCQNCWWTTNDWMHTCPRGLKTPECMVSIQPAAVVELAANYLKTLPVWEYSCEFVHGDHRPQLREIARDSGRPGWGYVLEAFLREALPDSAWLDGTLPVPESWTDNRLRETDGFLACGGLGIHALPYKEIPVSLYNLPFDDATFDLAVVTSFTGRIGHPEFALHELLRTIADGGRLVLSFDFTDSPSASNPGSSTIADTPAAIKFVDLLKSLGIVPVMSEASLGSLVICKRRRGQGER